MKRFFTLALIISTFLSLNASDWIELRKDGQATKNIELVSSNVNTSSIHFTLNGFWKNDIETSMGNAWVISAENSGLLLNNGAPELPVFATSLIIPNQANMQVNIVSSQYKEFQNVLVAPSKGNLSRTIDPSEVPYEFGKQYTIDSYYPSEISGLREPYIVRDFRAQTVLIKPVQYNPVTKVLRVYYDITIELVENGISNINTLPTNNQINAIDATFSSVYARQLLNYGNLNRYDPVDETGNMLIISYGDFMDAVQPLIDWKIMSGTPVEIVDVATIGNAAAIKQFIADYYTDNGLTFVLLIGDSQQVPSSSIGGNDSDVNYSYIVGNDHYPDLFVGRFSAQSLAQVETQVTRVLDYEINPIEDTDWFTKAIGIASNQGPGDDDEYDYEHIRNIGDNKLIPFTYDYAYELFDGSQGGNDAPGNPNPSLVAAAVNSGASIINYTGHGSTTSWGSSGFSNSDVNSLTNNGKLPFIISVACVNGNFVNSTCFAEAWLRAEYNDEPAGAIATFMSTINQSWNPPMRGQDAIADILTETYAENIKHTFGGITMNGCMSMNDVYGSDGDVMTDTWTIFGDPSLELRTAAPQDLVVNNPSTIFLGATSVSISSDAEGALATLSMDGEILGSAIVEGGVAIISFDALSNVGTANFVVTSFNYKPYISTIDIVPASGPYIVYSSSAVNDISGNNNGVLDYGEDIMLTVDLSNVGIEDAISVTTTLTTECEYIEIVNSEADYGDIAISDTVSVEDAFEFIVADDIPDYLSVSFQLTSVDENGKEIWESTFILTSHAPVPDFGTYTIDDAAGNNNGRIDPGETVDFIIQVLNNGHSPTLEGELMASTSSEFLTVNTTNIDVAIIDAEGMQEVTVNVTTDPGTPVGTLVDLNLDYNTGSYGAYDLLQETVGLIVDDFESGDFSAFDWQFNNYPWNVVEGQSYEGNYAAKSEDINDNQTSTMELECSVIADGEISFYFKVSSESSWDYLKFYINGSMQDEWSGEVDWELATYDVSTGSNTFKWEYYKDGSVSNGDDCAWVDFIVLPAMVYTSVYAGADAEICEGDVAQCAGSATNYVSQFWETSGTGIFDDDLSFTPIYTPSEDDYIAGSVMLTLNIVDTDEQPASDDMILSFITAPIQANMPVGPESVDLNIVSQSEYTTEIMLGVDTYSWSLFPPEAGIISGTEIVGVVDWDMEFEGEAWVKVAGVNDCGIGIYSDSLFINVTNSVGIYNVTESVDVSIVPNPSNGRFTVSVSSKQNSVYNISIVNTIGNIIMELPAIDFANISEKSFDLGDVQAGIYFVIVQNNDSRIVKKLLIRNN